MVKEFEVEVLKYLVRDKNGVSVLTQIPETFLKDPYMAIVLHVIKTYHREYGSIPHKANLKQYIADSAELDTEVQRTIYNLVGDIYDHSFDVDREHLKAKIVKEVQVYQTKEMIARFMDDPSPDFEGMFKDMRKILDVGDSLYTNTDARFVLKDFTGFNHITYDDVISMPFPGMNDMMSAGGIFAPQILVIMAPPKGFKSGIMINMAVHCIMQGKKVFYADFENGEDDIINRIYCRLTEADYNEMTNDITEETLREVVKFAGVRGGDVFVKSYEMYRGTPSQVRADIEKHIANDWHPDIIFWDYADVASPSSRDDKRSPRRLQIQSVYGEIKNINKEFKVPSVTASQMNRESFNKPVADMEDIAEDIGKAANSDAIYAVIQTEEEKQKEVGRLQPIVQRKGVSFTGSEFVYLRLSKGKQMAEEITYLQWENSVDVEIEDDLEDI